MLTNWVSRGIGVEASHTGSDVESRRRGRGAKVGIFRPDGHQSGLSRSRGRLERLLQTQTNQNFVNRIEEIEPAKFQVQR